MKTIAQKWYVVVITMMMACCGLVNGCMAEEGVLLAGGELTNWEMIRKNQDKGVFYNSKACNTTGGGGAMLLSGDTIEEKIWNYFVQAGIPGVSDDPAVIAGIMGNFYTESGYNPFMRGSNYKYRALWMLMDSYNGKRYALDLANDVNAAVGGNYWRFYGWWGSYTDADKKLTQAGVSEEAINTAIRIELDYLTKSEAYQSDWNGFVNNLDWVTNKTPSGYSDLFLVKIERAVGGSSPIADPGVRSHVSGNYQGSAKRRQAAEDAYKRLANSSTTSVASFSGDSDAVEETESASSSTSSSHSSGIDLAAATSEITLVGDSISVYSESELMKKFPNSFLNKVGSRHSTTKGWCDGDEGGLSVLKKIVSGSGTIMNQHQGQSKCEAVSVDSSALKENVVWALGTNTNGAKNQSTLEGVLEAIGGRKLYLVTPYNMIPDRMGDTDEIADLYRSFADAHDNVYVIDWNKNVRDNVSQYIDNSDHLGVHPTSAGSELFAKLIAEAVSGSRSCTTYSGDYPQYLQCDARWKDKKYGGSTMCDAGCGPASLAMLVTVATGKDVSPMDVAEITQDPPYYLDKVGGEWKRDDNTRKVCEKFGCEAKEIENTEDAIRQALKEGWMIHLSGGGGSTASETAFPTDGHYVGIFSIDDEDNVMIADPAGDAHQNKKGRFNRKLTLNNALKDRWKDRPIMAIRGNGGNSGKNTCEVAGTYCAAEGSEGDISASLSGEGDQPVGSVTESSDNVACDSRTTDIGVHNGYFNYVLKKIRLCALDKPGFQIKSSGAEENGRYGFNYSGGYAVVNSRVSGSYAGLAGRYYSQNNKVMQANSSFRSNEHQTALWHQYGHDPKQADRPGHSRHQGGLAVDFSGACKKYVHPNNCHTPMVNWLKKNLGDFGLALTNSIESWHVQPPW